MSDFKRTIEVYYYYYYNVASLESPVQLGVKRKANNMHTSIFFSGVLFFRQLEIQFPPVLLNDLREASESNRPLPNPHINSILRHLCA